MDNITKNFEETIKILAIPFLFHYNKKNKTTRNLDDSIKDDELLIQYKSETEKLNDYYNIHFNNINSMSMLLLTSTKTLYNNEEALSKELPFGIIHFNEIIYQMRKEMLHESLKLIKESFISFLIKTDKVIEY